MATESPEARFERWRNRGDGAALSDVFDALAPGLLRLAIHLVGDPSAAEDLVQQTFVTAMERASTWDARRPLEPWLQGILANHARDLRKLAWRAHDPDFDLEAVLARAEDAPLESASRRELSGELARAVDALEEPYRAAVLLRLRHGMEAADIAHVLGRSPGAVRVQLHRARELLRKSLPASIASALVALAGSARGMDTARGLETVRNQVLEHAARLAPAASVSGGLLGGALVMKKIVLAAVVLLAALAAFLAWTNGADAPAHEVALATTSTVLARPTQPVAAAEPLEPAAASTRTVESIAVEQTVEDEVFSGIVLDAENDQPIAGARIALYPPLRLSLREVRTRWWDRLQAMSDGDLSSAVWPQLDERTTAAQRAGLEPVRVRVAPTEGDQPIAETTSGPDGRFRLAAESVDGLLTCDALGFARREVTTVRPYFPASTEERTIYLARNVTFRGAIVDASGAPIRESIALSLVGHAPRVFQSQNEPMRESHMRSVIVRTETDGRFETQIDAHLVFVHAVDPRWVVVEPRRGDPAKPSWPQVPWFDFVEGSGEAYVVLRPALSLLVRDADTGAPIEDAHVCVRESATAIPRMSGWFHLEGGRLGLERETQSYVHAEEAQAKRSGMTCTVWAPGHARASVTIPGRSEARVVEVELARDDSGFVRGRVSHGAQAAGGARLFALEVNPTSAARSEETPPRSAASSRVGTAASNSSCPRGATCSRSNMQARSRGVRSTCPAREISTSISTRRRRSKSS